MMQRQALSRHTSANGRPRPVGRAPGNHKCEDAPFFHSNDEAVPPRLQKYEDDEVDLALLGDFNEIFDTTIAVKPQDQFVHEAWIISLYKYLTGATDTSMKSEVLCQPGKSSLGSSENDSLENNPPRNDADSRGQLGCCVFIVYDYIATYLKRHVANDSCGESSQLAHLAEEDGLFVCSKYVSTANHSPVSKPRNALRVEERLRRDLSLRTKPIKEFLGQGCKGEKHDRNAHPDKYAVIPNEEFITAKIDESFWMSPGLQPVGPKKRGGNIPREIELTIHVRKIKLSQHPEFIAEEKAFSRVNDLYEEYRKHLDANSFHYSVSRLSEIMKHIRSAKRNEESKESLASTPNSMMVPLLDDLKSTSSDLIVEFEYLKSISLQIKQVWKELVVARDSAGFSCVDVELKTAASAISELTNDVNRLAGEMKPTKRILNRIRRDKLYLSTESSFQFLDDVESTLSNINDISEVLELAQQPNQSQPGWIPKEEKSRRQRVISEKYFVRLILNGSTVGDTKAEHLDWPSFCVKLNHKFNCRMAQKPTDACIQIWKSAIGFMPDNLICNCFVNVQDDETIISGQNEENPNQDSLVPAISAQIQFSSCGSDLHRRTKGLVWLTSGCKVRMDNCPSAATHMTKIPRQDATFFRPSKRLIRPPLEDYVAQDENKAQVKNLICPDRQSLMAFKLSVNGFLFSNKVLFEEPIRHVLIKKRQSNALSVPSPIPITELEVQNHRVYNDLIRYEDDESSEIIRTDATKSRDSVKKQHILDICRAFKEHAELNEICRRRQHFSEVIRDVGIHRFANDDEFELPFPPKRSLFPKSDSRLPVRNQTQRCSLLLTVVGGKNVPMKMVAENSIDSMPRQPKTANDGGHREILASIADDEDEAYLGALIKIKFRGEIYQTKLVKGTMSPQWKQTIRIPLPDILDADSSVSPILHQDEGINITVFDCIRVDVSHMGGYYDDEETRTAELRYLGHVNIPLVGILREGTIDGFVRCHSPDMIVGYMKDGRPLIPNGEEDRHQETTSDSTMLRLHVTADPYTAVPPKFRPEFVSNESETIMSRTQKWSQQHFKFDETKPNDCYPILWPDSRGNSYILSRFITEQCPPLGVDTLTSCAHYVSLIPSLDSVNLEAFEGRDSMILTSQQFLDIMAGNAIEHAILLTNFFLFLSKTRSSEFGADVFLAAGFSIPEGRTALVVRRCQKTRDVVFWDAMTGCAYPQNDESCPLQKIFFLATTDKILGNIEREKRPFLLDFDTSNPRRWSPLNLGGIMTVQDETLKFSPADKHYARQIQNRSCDDIHNAIRGWRRVATSFRSDVSTKVASKLYKLEEARMNGKPVSESDMILPESVIKSRTVFGFTLHAPYSSLQDILDRVKATEIHTNKNPRVEYAVAVGVFAYPGGVISLWVFVCSLVPLSSLR